MRCPGFQLLALLGVALQTAAATLPLRGLGAQLNSIFKAARDGGSKSKVFNQFHNKKNVFSSGLESGCKMC